MDKKEAFREYHKAELVLAIRLYNLVVVPFMKRYKLTIVYENGAVWFKDGKDKLWNYISHGSVVMLHDYLDNLCKYTSLKAGRYRSIWWIVQLVDPDNHPERIW